MTKHDARRARLRGARLPTLEMYLVASPTPMERTHDNALNVELLAP